MQLIDASLAAAASNPDVVRNLSQARALYATDKDAALKLLDETKNAQSLLILANRSDESQGVGGAVGNQVSSGNHRSVTPVEDIAAGVRSSSEQSVASEEKSW